MAQAVYYSRFGGPEVVEVVEVPDRAPGWGEVAVDVHALSLGAGEYKRRRGGRGGPDAPPAPVFVGQDATGVISELGADVGDWEVGDEVVVNRLIGSHASRLVVPVWHLTRKPAALDWISAAGLSSATATAYQSIKSLGVGPGDVLLVHGGGSAVGRAAVQLALLWGAEAVVATASAHNHEALASLGAIPVEYGPGLYERLVAALPSEATVAYDAAGSEEAVETSLQLVADRGRIGTVAAGNRAGDLGIRAFRGLSSIADGGLSDEEWVWRKESIGVVAQLAVEGRFRLDTDSVHLLSRSAEAHARADAGHLKGKIVVVPDHHAELIATAEQKGLIANAS